MASSQRAAPDTDLPDRALRSRAVLALASGLEPARTGPAGAGSSIGTTSGAATFSPPARSAATASSMMSAAAGSWSLTSASHCSTSGTIRIW